MSLDFRLDENRIEPSRTFGITLKWGAAMLRPYMDLGGWD
jgi:hypothetical protein